MPTPTATKTRKTGWWPRDAAAWLGLAASPSFTLMAWISATDAPRMALCSSASALLPIDGMAWMYLLMGLFHLSPWLKLAFGRRRQLPHATAQN